MLPKLSKNLKQFPNVEPKRILNSTKISFSTRIHVLMLLYYYAWIAFLFSQTQFVRFLKTFLLMIFHSADRVVCVIVVASKPYVYVILCVCLLVCVFSDNSRLYFVWSNYFYNRFSYLPYFA